MEKMEKRDVIQASEIELFYNKVQQENVKYYRAISKTNSIYGWDAKTRKLLREENAVLVDGEKWFENSNYVEPIAETLEDIIEEPVVEPLNEIKDVEEEIDYKVLYESKCVEYEELKVLYEDLQERFKAEKAIYDSYKETVDNFFALGVPQEDDE